MLDFKEFLMYESNLRSPDEMKKTFDAYFKHTKGQVSVDHRDKNKLNFSTTKSTAKEIFCILDSVLGYAKNKFMTISPIEKINDSDKFFHFSITFRQPF